MENKPYQFTWGDLGEIEVGRPNLGSQTFVSVYRLMQFTMRSVLVNRFGDDEARGLFVEAGTLAGKEFCLNVLDRSLPFAEFVSQLSQKLIELNIGILKIERADLEHLDFTLTVSEDLDCSGLPIGGATVCDYDEGFIAGIFNEYTGKSFSAREIDCWSTGDRTCRFHVHVKRTETNE